MINVMVMMMIVIRMSIVVIIIRQVLGQWAPASVLFVRRCA